MVMDDTWSYCGDHFIMYKNIESRYYIPETNMILYINKKSIKNVQEIYTNFLYNIQEIYKKH